VDVPKKKTNLMLVGDGIGKTVVKASRNVVDGWTTFQSSTFGKFNYFYLSLLIFIGIINCRLHLDIKKQKFANKIKK
jgi:hypothetical protein